MIVERDSIESDCEELAKHLRKPDFDEVVTVTKEAPLKLTRVRLALSKFVFSKFPPSRFAS